MQGGQRDSSVDVDVGLHLVQYASSGDPGLPPSVQVEIAPHSLSRAQIITDPRDPPGELPAPGTSLVVRAEGPATLRLIVHPRSAGASTDARVEVRALGPKQRSQQPQPERARRSSAPVSSPSSAPGAGLRLLAHVARRGDVWAEAGEWVGGPSAPLPVEGVEIHEPAGSGRLGLEYQVLTGKRQQRWSDWTPAGRFAGTRGKATPLFGIRLRVGPAYALRAEGLFLGAAILTKAGTEIELVGQTGREPLVGLSLRLDQQAGEQHRPAQDQARERGARVRVFRASSI